MWQRICHQRFDASFLQIVVRFATRVAVTVHEFHFQHFENSRMLLAVTVDKQVQLDATVSTVYPEALAPKVSPDTTFERNSLRTREQTRDSDIL
jgi:hypothetical protein